MASILDFDLRGVKRMLEPETGFIGQECLHRRGIWLQLLKDIQERAPVSSLDRLVLLLSFGSVWSDVNTHSRLNWICSSCCNSVAFHFCLFESPGSS